MTMVDPKSQIVDTSDIAGMKSDIATNQSDISQNASDIATNQSDISQNAGDIATNKSDIAGIKAANNVIGWF